MRFEEFTIEGRNAVMEAFRAGRTIDKIFVLDGSEDGAIRSIIREAKKKDAIIDFVKKERLDQISKTGKHQGVIAYAAAYEYCISHNGGNVQATKNQYNNITWFISVVW